MKTLKSKSSHARRNASAVYTYTSKCCNAPARKPPCEHALEDRKDGKWSQSPLGTWNCSVCRKKCSVTRTKREKVTAPIGVQETRVA